MQLQTFRVPMSKSPRQSVARFVPMTMICVGSRAYAQPAASLVDPSIRRQEAVMSFLVWIVIGLVFGFLGSQLAPGRGRDILPHMLLGLVGAITGGWLFYAFGPVGLNGLNLNSHFTAAAGSLAVLLAWHGLRRH
jgi:uncharacterized membrane protein YeaQ/YmgE (transglycosylase-associated protein family)